MFYAEQAFTKLFIKKFQRVRLSTIQYHNKITLNVRFLKCCLSLCSNKPVFIYNEMFSSHSIESILSTKINYFFKVHLEVQKYFQYLKDNFTFYYLLSNLFNLNAFRTLQHSKHTCVTFFKNSR